MPDKSCTCSIAEALGEKVEKLLSIRNSLDEKPVIAEDKWVAINEASWKISEAVEQRDLESLVAAVRTMKNKLRRPHVKRALSNMAEEEDKKKGGDCKCAKCGKPIPDSSAPCHDDGLCVKCAMGKKTSDEKSRQDKDQKPNKKAEKKSDKKDVKESLRTLVNGKK